MPGICVVDYKRWTVHDRVHDKENTKSMRAHEMDKYYT